MPLIRCIAVGCVGLWLLGAPAVGDEKPKDKKGQTLESLLQEPAPPPAEEPAPTAAPVGQHKVASAKNPTDKPATDDKAAAPAAVEGPPPPTDDNDTTTTTAAKRVKVAE